MRILSTGAFDDSERRHRLGEPRLILVRIRCRRLSVVRPADPRQLSLCLPWFQPVSRCCRFPRLPASNMSGWCLMLVLLHGDGKNRRRSGDFEVRALTDRQADAIPHRGASACVSTTNFLSSSPLPAGAAPSDAGAIPAEEVEDPRRSCDANPERHRWNAVAVAAAAAGWRPPR